MFRKYFVALLNDWVALMSGIASIILAFWVAYFPPPTAAAGRTLLWITAVTCFVLSSYRVWAKEHKIVLAKEAELEGMASKISNQQIRRVVGQDVLIQMAEFIKEGGGILNKVAAHLVTAPYQEQAEEWSSRVEDYLNKNGLQPYAIRFGNEAVSYRYQGMLTSNTQPLLNYLNTRVMRLEEFIKELGK